MSNQEQPEFSDLGDILRQWTNAGTPEPQGPSLRPPKDITVWKTDGTYDDYTAAYVTDVGNRIVVNTDDLTVVYTDAAVSSYEIADMEPEEDE